MTEKEIAKEIEGRFKDGVANSLPVMTVDFRKLEARYVCTARGNESLCIRFQQSFTGKACGFRNTEDNTCYSQLVREH